MAPRKPTRRPAKSNNADIYISAGMDKLETGLTKMVDAVSELALAVANQRQRTD